MNENEKKIRDVVEFLREEDYPNTARNMDAALDALLAEHRAEVERLRAALAESGGAWRADVVSARDAVLEEATNTGVRAVRGWMGGKGPGLACDEYVEREMRALQSRPASVVPVAKVREVMTSARAALRDSGMSTAVVLDMAGALSIDLDATPERPAGCVACGGQHKFSESCKVPR